MQTDGPKLLVSKPTAFQSTRKSSRQAASVVCELFSVNALFALVTLGFAIAGMWLSARFLKANATAFEGWDTTMSASQQWGLVLWDSVTVPLGISCFYSTLRVLFGERRCRPLLRPNMVFAWVCVPVYYITLHLAGGYNSWVSFLPLTSVCTVLLILCNSALISSTATPAAGGTLSSARRWTFAAVAVPQLLGFIGITLMRYTVFPAYLAAKGQVAQSLVTVVGMPLVSALLMVISRALAYRLLKHYAAYSTTPAAGDAADPLQRPPLTQQLEDPHHGDSYPVHVWALLFLIQLVLCCSGRILVSGLRSVEAQIATSLIVGATSVVARSSLRLRQLLQRRLQSGLASCCCCGRRPSSADMRRAMKRHSAAVVRPLPAHGGTHLVEVGGVGSVRNQHDHDSHSSRSVDPQAERPGAGSRQRRASFLNAQGAARLLWGTGHSTSGIARPASAAALAGPGGAGAGGGGSIAFAAASSVAPLPAAAYAPPVAAEEGVPQPEREQKLQVVDIAGGQRDSGDEDSAAAAPAAAVADSPVKGPAVAASAAGTGNNSNPLASPHSRRSVLRRHLKLAWVEPQKLAFLSESIICSMMAEYVAIFLSNYCICLCRIVLLSEPASTAIGESAISLVVQLAICLLADLLAAFIEIRYLHLALWRVWRERWRSATATATATAATTAAVSPRADAGKTNAASAPAPALPCCARLLACLRVPMRRSLAGHVLMMGAALAANFNYSVYDVLREQLVR